MPASGWPGARTSCTGTCRRAEALQVPTTAGRRGRHLPGHRILGNATAMTGRRQMVISLWQGDMCTGTFRLPAKEGARLISTLAYGLTEAISDQGPTHEGKPGSLGKTWSRVVRRLLSRSPVQPDTTLRLLE
jgi:hypothetical protein